jgi:hypothetical protein
MTDTMPPTVIACPVLDCGWTTDASGPSPESVQRETLADVFGPGVYAAVAVTQNAWRLERVLDAHFRSHSTAEYVRTMAAQAQRIADEVGRLQEAEQRAGAYRGALTAVAEVLRLEVPPDLEDLVAWACKMRATLMRLRHNSAASGRGWGQ